MWRLCAKATTNKFAIFYGLMALHALAACGDSDKGPNCDAIRNDPTSVNYYMGHSVDDMIAHLPNDNYRIIRPNDPVTRDLRRDRLNLVLDDNDIVADVGCY